MPIDNHVQLELPFDPKDLRDNSGPKKKEETRIQFPSETAIRGISLQDLRRAQKEVYICQDVQLLEEYCNQCSSMRFENYDKKTWFGLKEPKPCQRWYCSKKSLDDLIGIKEGDDPAEMFKGIPTFCDYQKEYLEKD